MKNLIFAAIAAMCAFCATKTNGQIVLGQISTVGEKRSIIGAGDSLARIVEMQIQ